MKFAIFLGILTSLSTAQASFRLHCTDTLTLESLVVTKNDPRYESVKRELFKNDGALITEFELLPDWAQADFLAHAYRRFDENGFSFRNLEACR